MYDSQTKQGSLTHIDATVDAAATVSDMRRAFETTRKDEEDGNKRYIVTISGGSLGMLRDVVEAYDVLKSWKAEQGDRLDIVVGNMFTSYSKAIALKLDTGELQHFIPSHELTEVDSRFGRMAMTARAMAQVVHGKKVARFNPPSRP